jgi:hypothetical protein
MTDIGKTANSIANIQSSEIKELFPAAADEALNFLRAEDLPSSGLELDERAVVRKIDWMIMPVRHLSGALPLRALISTP